MITLIHTSGNGLAVYRLTNSHGHYVDITTYGASIMRLCVPDAQGNLRDVVAGFDTIQGFMGDHPYFNAVIGRVGNRIDHGRFALDGTTYQLHCNDGAHHLHGGLVGFNRRVWTATPTQDSLQLHYTSPHMEEGYPGTLSVTVTYRLDDTDGLHIDYTATGDRPTPCNLTNHAYFNLDGDFVTNHNHVVWIDADYLTDVDDDLIPHGALLPLADTPHDFSTPKPIGRDLAQPDRLLAIARGGYDFNYVLRPHDLSHPVASAYSPDSGIRLNVYTDQPCLQFYTGNFLDGLVGKRPYPYQSAFCMETQGYPNAVNVPTFPSVILHPGDAYHTHTIYRFDVIQKTPRC